MNLSPYLDTNRSACEQHLHTTAPVQSRIKQSLYSGGCDRTSDQKIDHVRKLQAIATYIANAAPALVQPPLYYRVHVDRDFSIGRDESAGAGDG